MQTFLLVFTFVFGVLRLLTYTQLFKVNLVGIIEIIFPVSDHPIRKFFDWLDYLIFYGSLMYQAWYWIFR